MKILRLLSGALVLTSACGGQVGGTASDGGTPDARGIDGNGGGDTGTTEGGTGSTTLDGTWTGYIQSFMLPSGSDVISMTFQGNGPFTGTVTFGTQAAPAPATSPNVGYPTSVNWLMPVPDFLGEGFVYTALTIDVTSARVRLGVVSHELWKVWCGLQQQTYSWANGNQGSPYECVPNWGCGGSPTGCFQTNPTTNQMVAVDCGKLDLCAGGCGGAGVGPVCSCTATSCTVDMSTPDIKFDMQLSGNMLSGGMTGPLSPSVLNVYLTRQ